MTERDNAVSRALFRSAMDGATGKTMAEHQTIQYPKSGLDARIDISPRSYIGVSGDPTFTPPLVEMVVSTRAGRDIINLTAEQADAIGDALKAAAQKARGAQPAKETGE